MPSSCASFTIRTGLPSPSPRPKGSTAKFKMIAFVFSVIADSIIFGVTRKFSASFVCTNTHLPPQNSTMSLYETQYGTGHDHFIAVLDQHLGHVEDRQLAARRKHALVHGILRAKVRRMAVHNRLPNLRHAGHRGIARVVGSQSP